jgi:hypothetical protein
VSRAPKRRTVSERTGRPGKSAAVSAPAGARNAWKCEVCGGYTVAVHRDEGVTPFMIACRATVGCPGQARSRFYPPEPWPDWVPPVAWEWYRPDDA